MEFKWMIIIPLLKITVICVISGVVEGDSNHLKRHALKSIRSEDGDIIDCIDIYKQPAFDHPALKNHKIQMTPSYDLTKEKTTTAKSKIAQVWQKSGSCPNGTIPIRRIRKKDVFQAHSYGRKKPSYHVMEPNKTANLLLENHSIAVLLTGGYSYSGAKGDIKVWTPYVESKDEYSISRVTLMSGLASRTYSYEAVESGWAVNPSVYGDNQTRLFVYWTADASKNTGCFDITCPGFVQTQKDIALGAVLYPIRGLPYEISVYIKKDPYSYNWWVEHNGVKLGYWPPKLFQALSYQATSVQWGGEVYSTKVGGGRQGHPHPHTATAMGNGNYPDVYHSNSGYVKRMRIEENSHPLKHPEWAQPHSDEYDCYDVRYVTEYIQDPEFYYGGPGRSWKCP